MFAAFAVALWIGCGAPSPTPPVPLAGGSSSRVEFSESLLDLDGRPCDLWHGGDYQATVVVFTRSDCPISNRYAPTVRALHDAYHQRGVRFFLVYVDPREDAEHVRQHLKEYEYPCTAVRDPTHRLVAATGATVTPEAVVFNARREMVYRGRIDNWYAALGQSREVATTHDLADAIDATLNNSPIAEPVTKAVGCNIRDLL